LQALPKIISEWKQLGFEEDMRVTKVAIVYNFYNNTCRK
jgi:hypothetical protein